MTEPTMREVVATLADLIDPQDWALVVCIAANGRTEVHGRRDHKAAQALRMLADRIEGRQQ
jgi:hypothetical protein